MAENSYILADRNLKPGFILRMMGSLEAGTDIVAMKALSALSAPEKKPDADIIDDLDFKSTDKIDLAETENMYASKIERCVNDYDFILRNPFRDGKKLLVLDLDFTLFDHHATTVVSRPGLHYFLRNAYNYYDIVVWAANDMDWIEEKIKQLALTDRLDFKIALCLDNVAMVDAYTKKFGAVQVKALDIIWGKYPQFSSKNTIMVDDIRRNFLMNPQNGLRIKQFKLNVRRSYLDLDHELDSLSRYLFNIAPLDDFSELDHDNWKLHCYPPAVQYTEREFIKKDYY